MRLISISNKITLIFVTGRNINQKTVWYVFFPTDYQCEVA